MFTLWLYRFKPGTTEATLAKLQMRGLEGVYPGATRVRKEDENGDYPYPRKPGREAGQVGGGVFMGRLHGHPLYTHATMLERRGLAALRKETEDLAGLLANLRILSPTTAALEVRNFIDPGDPELVSLGRDGWHEQACAHYVDTAKANPEVAYHMNVIGMNCLKHAGFPPYFVHALWRNMAGLPYKWYGPAETPHSQPQAT